jgi:acyl CoA:acetate/3-ketoacid CoA transferase beta subunit
VTERAVFRVRDGSLVLTELLGESTLADVSSVTEARFTVELED